MINTEELCGLLLLNGYELSESKRLFDSNLLLHFYKELNSPLDGLTSSSLFFTKNDLKFINAEYEFDFASNMNNCLRTIIKYLSSYNSHTITQLLKGYSFNFDCFDRFRSRYFLIYRPYYFDLKKLYDVKKFSYYLENKNVYLDAYETENTFSNIPIFLNGEECVKYLRSLI